MLIVMCACFVPVSHWLDLIGATLLDPGGGDTTLMFLIEHLSRILPALDETQIQPHNSLTTPQ